MSHYVFLLDSGAFSVHSLGKKIELEDYAKFALSNKSLFKGGIFNLDVIGSGEKSYDNWITLKSMGLDTIPVHHMGDDENYLIKYLDQTDYIGTGGVARTNVSSRVRDFDYLWKKYLVTDPETMRNPRCRIHGLGLTDITCSTRYPWYSVDSTKAVIAASYGAILIPEKLGCYKNLRSLKVSNQTRIVQAGRSQNFFSLSKRVQDEIVKLCRSFGYDMEVSIEGRVLKPHKIKRKKKDPVWQDGLNIDIPFNPVDKVEIDRNINLSEYWEPRFGLNLRTIEEFLKYYDDLNSRRLRFYHVIGGLNILNVFVKKQPCMVARALVSYARLSDVVVDRIRELTAPSESGDVNGNRPGRIVSGRQDGIAGSSEERVI